MAKTQHIYINPSVEERFAAALENGRAVFFGAPCGCGKSVTAKKLLEKMVVDVRNAQKDDFLQQPFCNDCQVVLIDHLDCMSPDSRKLLELFIKDHRQPFFVFLSRGTLPGWLMPFEFTGVLTVFTMEDLLLEPFLVKKMLADGGISVGADELSSIMHDTWGFPTYIVIMKRLLIGGEGYNTKVFDNAKMELFRYFDEMVYKKFNETMQRFLLSLAPVEKFSPELAKIISGNAHAGELISELSLHTTILVMDTLGEYSFRKIVRQFIFWKMSEIYTPQELGNLYARAGVYYEMHGDIEHALECAFHGNDHERVSQLLEKQALLHPGVANYYQVEPYYRMLSEKDIGRSPSLMCGMSMLCALTLDFEKSNYWYGRLKEARNAAKRGSSLYRDLCEKVAYLNISLPQFGDQGLAETLKSLYISMKGKAFSVLSFSVTSMLPSIMNGGKDFCDWAKKDDLLYRTMKMPVEAVLGRDGVGLADCSICESKFEKGEDISLRVLNLAARIVEIQNRGTPDIEFAAIGLLAREQTARGKANLAFETVRSIRTKFEKEGNSRFFPNIDALLCRISMRMGDKEAVSKWEREKAPKDLFHLHAMWRYQYLTYAMVLIEKKDYETALLALSPLMKYCTTCMRRMDGLYIKVLAAIIFYRMQDPRWENEIIEAVEISREYSFVRPIAQFGAAVLPLLKECRYDQDPEFLKTIFRAARVEAIYYPSFMKEGQSIIEPLSQSEIQVLKLICENLSNQEISEILNIGVSTVKTHVSHIFQKLGVKKRSDAKTAADTLHLI